MTPQNISRHFPESDATQKGHMKQTKQGVRSTKIVDEDEMLAFKPQPSVKHKDVYLMVFDATKKSMFSDQTGKFPITSARGNKYIMVAVELDGNHIDGEDSPYPHIQYAEYDTSAPVVTGKFNWYARGVDGTLLTPISALSAQQAKPTQSMMKRVKQFLDYAATQEPAVTTYHASDMVLAIPSDAGYLNEEGARSCVGVHHFLSENVDNPSNNGAIYNEASIIKLVTSSAAEAEIGALYINARKGVEIRNILKEMGHMQPPPPVQTDNSTADGIVNLRVQPKRTKAMDMRFHWLRDREVNQK